MWSALDRPALQGVRLTVLDLDAAVAQVHEVLGLARDPGRADDGEDIARFRIGTHWLAFQRSSTESLSSLAPNDVATLHWRCSDLQRQRMLLAQLGFDSQEDAEPGAPALLRVVAAETGACALQWDAGAEAVRVCSEAPSSPGISALVLHTRAPERVAAHWAQVFQVCVERHAAGVPRLVLGGLSVQFVFAEEGAGGIGRMSLSLPDASDVRARAIASGAIVDGDAFTLAGLTISLANAWAAPAS